MTSVMHVLNDVRRLGNGIVNAVVDLACVQGDRGHDVVVASAGGEYVDLLAAHGVRHLLVPDIRRPHRMLSAASVVRRAVRGHDVEVVHAHMNYSALVARAAVAGTPARVVATAHTSFKRESTLQAVADLVIAPSTAVADALRRRGVRRSRIRVVPNGPIGSPREPANPTPADLARPAVLTVAGLYERKGVDLVISAFASASADVPAAHLYVVGDGPQRPALTALAAGTAVSDRVHFLGFRDDVMSLLRGADVFVLASRSEPFGLAVVEAREAGCAVVGSAVDGLPEACDFGRAGWLFPSGDEASLAAALRSLLRDPVTLQRWRSAAKEGLEKYTVSRVADDVADVYEELLGGRQRR